MSKTKFVNETVTEISTPCDEMQAADRKKEDLARMEDALQNLGLVERRSRGRGGDAAVDLRKAMQVIVHQRHVPRWRDLDSLAADHLRHEVIGQVVVERRDRAGRAHPEEAARRIAARYSGICTMSSHSSGRSFLLAELLLAVR